jgi:hypothetical protein
VLTIVTFEGDSATNPANAITEGDSDFKSQDEGKTVSWKASFDQYTTVAAVRVKSSKIFSDAWDLREAKVMVGD